MWSHLFQFYYFLREGDTFTWNTDFYSVFCLVGPGDAVYFWKSDNCFKVFLVTSNSFNTAWSAKHKILWRFPPSPYKRHMKEARIWNSWSSQICKPFRSSSLSSVSIKAVVQLLSCVRLFVTPWTAARQVSLSSPPVKVRKKWFWILVTHDFTLDGFINLYVVVASVILRAYLCVYWIRTCMLRCFSCVISLQPHGL